MRNEDQSKERRQGAQVKAKLSRMSPSNGFDFPSLFNKKYLLVDGGEGCRRSLLPLAFEGKKGYRVSDPDDIGTVRLVGWLMMVSCPWSTPTLSFFYAGTVEFIRYPFIYRKAFPPIFFFYPTLPNETRRMFHYDLDCFLTSPGSLRSDLLYNSIIIERVLNLDY